ncbi:MAG: sigma-70 family RNA polymerase sigma factor, partial [Polyangiaceae bacterium]|nr:sigma-70 family RNA polymerase sigma factor [Polyangiaceae bacterium]
HRDRRASLWEKFGPALVEVIDADGPEQSRDEVARLEDCLSQLSERSRDLIRYAYVDELSNVEIAARLALAEGNVRVVRHRTLGALRDCMHPQPDSEGP